MIPIKRHEIKVYAPEGHSIETSITRNNVECSIDKNYKFLYCVAYRHPSEPEWIVARGYWNDMGIWIPEGIWYDN